MSTSMPTETQHRTIDNSFPSSPWEVHREGNSDDDYSHEGYSTEEGPGSAEFVDENFEEDYDVEGMEEFESADDEEMDEGFGGSEEFANDTSFEWEGNVEPFREPGEEFFEAQSFFKSHQKHIIIAAVLAIAVGAWFYYKKK